MSDSNSYFIVIIICLQTLYTCILSIIGQYIYGYFLRTYYDMYQNWTIINNSSLKIDIFELNREQCIENTTDISNSSAQTWAQQQSADLIFQATLWRAFPIIIITYLFGLYASQLNRRLVLILSIIGNAIHVIIYQAIIYKNLAEYWWYISAFIVGLSGGPNILGIVMNLVITESTEENERSSRFVRYGAMATALAAIATFGIGYYIQWRGYTDLLWISLGLELLSIFTVIFFLKPTHYSTSIDETTALLSSSSSNDVHVTINTSTISKFYHCFDICTVFSFRHCSKKKSISLILIIISYMFYLLALSSLSTMLWYLLGTPFCWTSKDLGQFSAVSLIATAIFSVLGMKILNYIGANDAIICILSHICFGVYLLWISLAQYGWQLYLALLINPFSSYQNILTIPMISKWLEVHERNNVFTLVTEINTIITAFGGSLSNWIYARTVIYQKNFTLLLASGICIIPCILNICLFMISRRISNEQELTRISEINAEPTTLLLSNNLSPQAVDVTCLIQLPHSRTHSLCTSYNDRSRTNSNSSLNNQSDWQVTI
ncbi:unnamed protein product [Rotaria sordida]|uniref:Proton-coupled folate transporter n=1 Tax=Rotaria sordida TaxID=392033 RepID=A0A819DZJ8_9BILA|nr:unnamed protein product [Rotaria sordida]CAF4027708.1 unnamed protein product [Rotaria sordida]